MQTLLKTLTSSNRWMKRWEHARRSCGLIACTIPKSSWTRLWRPRTGTLLQGVFYCQSKCLETALTAQLARLYPLTPAAPPSNRIPLGLLMVARGWLTHEQVVVALAAQQSAHSGKIGDWFQKLGFATEQQVTSALGLQWGCPVVSSLDPADAVPFGGIPLGILEAFQMAAFRVGYEYSVHCIWRAGRSRCAVHHRESSRMPYPALRAGTQVRSDPVRPDAATTATARS